MTEDAIERVYRLLGNDVILIPLPLGRKGPTEKRWPETTLAKSRTPQWQALLRKGNAGVLMCGGLVTIDCDEPNFFNSVLALNPWLANTLQTRGKRAGTYWVRIVGNYPAKIYSIKYQGNPVGEWRGAGQTIIHGKHPEGMAYQVLNECSPLELQVTDIKWPEGMNPFQRGRAREPMQHSNTVTQSPRDTVTQLHSHPVDTETHVVNVCECILVDVSLFLPMACNQNNAHLFNLARAVLAEELKLERQATTRELMAILKAWYADNSFLDPDNTFDDYWLEFMRAMDSAKVPLGRNTLTHAIELASREPLPDIAFQFNDKAKRTLIAVLYQMQILTHPKPFFITCRDAAAIPCVGIDYTTAHRWLQSFCSRRTGFLDLVKRGSLVSREGNEYRFRLSESG